MTEPVRPTSALTRYYADIFNSDGLLYEQEPVYLASEVDTFIENERHIEETAERLTQHEVETQLRAEVARLTRERDEYKALASVGTWHKDCRPNRRKAAEEIQKSQQRIDALAAEVARLTEQLAAAPAGGRPTADEKTDDGVSRIDHGDSSESSSPPRNPPFAESDR